jgi:hypothetical protein
MTRCHEDARQAACYGFEVCSKNGRHGTMPRCEQPVLEIDYYGERLTGCLECYRWRGRKRAFIVELSVFKALRG